MKRTEATKPKEQSKYAKKIARRRRRAVQLGLPPTATFPEIWQFELEYLGVIQSKG